jgi:hypothetical protein
LGEHLLCTQEVIGSIPFTSTIENKGNNQIKVQRWNLKGGGAFAVPALSV